MFGIGQGFKEIAFKKINIIKNMGKISKRRRSFEIKNAKKRRGKIKRLKEQCLVVKNEKEKNDILEEIRRIAPYYPAKNILKLK